MKYLKTICLIVLAAIALIAFAAAGTASATKLEIEEAAQNQPIAFIGSLSSGQPSMAFQRTDGVPFNTCNESDFNGETVEDEDGDYTGPTVNATLLELSFADCTTPITVHKAGKFVIEWTKNTEATVLLSGAELTVTWGAATFKCQTGTGAHIGTLTGVATGNATLHIQAVLGCGFLLPSIRWEGIYEFTSPNGLGVVE